MSLVEIPTSYKSDWQEHYAQRRRRMQASAVPDTGLCSPRERRQLLREAAIREQEQREEQHRRETKMACAAAIAERLAYEPLPKPTKITIADVQKAICAEYKITREDLIGHRRPAGITRHRHIGMFLSKRITQQSLPEIGRRFQRDHTTVLAALRKIEARREVDPTLDAELSRLEQQVRDASADSRQTEG